MYQNQRVMGEVTMKIKITKLLTIVTMLVVMLSIAPVPVLANTQVSNGDTVIAGSDLYDLDLSNGDFDTCSLWATAVDIRTGSPMKTIDMTAHNEIRFDIAAYQGYGGYWRCYNKSITDADYIMQSPRFYLVVPVITQEPTPLPTPSTGTLVISSDPSDATVYVDNVIKGITPLNVTVMNGEHSVRIRLDGYQESKTMVVVSGKDLSVEPTLVRIPAPATSIPTTIQTTPPTVAETTTPLTTILPEVTTIPTVAINYSETIASIQKQIEVQATKNIEQDEELSKQSEQIAEQSEDIDFLTRLIDQIMSFIGLK